MEFCGGWFLDYKDANTMQSLAEGLNARNHTLTMDSFGVYQYLLNDA